jgi:hypothetical protein
VGLGGLLARAAANLEHYVGRVLGAEWWGGVELLAPAVAVLGAALVLLALWGWGARLAEGRVGLAELFLPLYGGLVLVWPEVWAGDRFVLPLYPLLLLWAGETGARLVTRLRMAEARPRPWLPALAGGLAVAVLAVPALPGVLAKVEQGAACRALATIDPYACYGDGLQGVRDAAEWSAANLPEGAVVINRRPRSFHLMGGPPGRVFPFEEDAGPTLAEADRVGARYLLLDRTDGISRAYLPAIVGSRLQAFCWIEEWRGSAVLLGILPPDRRDGPPPPDGALAPCDLAGGDWVRAGPPQAPAGWGHRVPVVLAPRGGERPR